MRVAFLTDPAAWSGAEAHTLELAAVLARRGHAVTIVQRGWDLYSSKIAARGIDAQVVTGPIGYRGLKALRADLGVLIRGNTASGDPVSDATHRLAVDHFVAIEHMTPPPAPRRPAVQAAPFPPRLGLWWYRDAMRRRSRALWPQLTVCVSNAVKAGLVRECGFPASRVTTIHNGVDLETFRRDPAAGRAWRLRCGIDADARVFGAVCRLSPMKNLALAIRGIATLRSHDASNAWLVLAGDGPERSALENAAQHAGVADRVCFAGQIDAAAAVYSAIDVFVMPSLSEGLPLALLEAMACECAPIAAAVGGIPEVLSRPGTGALVPRGSDDAFDGAFIDAMRAFASTPDSRLRAIGACARRHVDSHFNAAVQYPALAELLEWHAGAAGPAMREQRAS